MQVLDYNFSEGSLIVWLTTSRKDFDDDKNSLLFPTSTILVDELPEELPTPIEEWKFSQDFLIEDIFSPDTLAELRLAGFMFSTVSIQKEV